jgi:hypothetical protein
MNMSTSASLTENNLLRAGVSKCEITIRRDDIPVHDPLFARTLVVADDEKRLVIVALDAVAIGAIADIKDDFLPKLRGRILEEFGIPESNVVVTASHTHPSNELLCPENELLERVLSTVREAVSSLGKVRVGVGKGHEDRIIINRTLLLKNGKAWTVRLSNPSPPDDEVAELGPIDPEIGLLKIDRLDGSTLAVVYNYACHSLIGIPSGAITANFPGFASEVIEQHYDGALAIFMLGAAGDVTEVLYKDVNRPRDARPLGMMLGLSAVKALKTISTSGAKLGIIHEKLELPRRTDSDERIAELEQERDVLLASLRFSSLNLKAFIPLYTKYLIDPDHPADYSYRYLQEKQRGVDDLRLLDLENRRNMEKYLHNVRAMEALTQLVDSLETLKKHRQENLEAGGKPIATEVTGFRIGDFVMITSATEVLTEVGLNIKRASPHPNTFISAYTNGYLHYGAPVGDYSRGGYEVLECLLAPEWQAAYEEKAFSILHRL